MRTRPKRLLLLAAFLVLLAFSLPVQIMALYGHSPNEAGAIAAKLAPLNWGILLFAPLAAWLAYRASIWLIAILPPLVGLVFYNNWLVGQMGTDYSPLTAMLGALAFLGVAGAMLNRESLRVLLNPGSRWWLTPARRKLAIPVRLKFLSRTAPKKSLEGLDEFYIRTFDISEGGAFIPLQQAGPERGDAPSTTLEARFERDPKARQVFHAILQNLAVGTQCYVCLPLKDVSFITCRAEVVRNTQGRGEYPAGVGLRFLGLSWAEKRRIQHFLNDRERSVPSAPARAEAAPKAGSGDSERAAA